MNRPKIDMIRNVFELIDEKWASGTIEHLIKYIEFLEVEIKQLDDELKDIKG